MQEEKVTKIKEIGFDVSEKGRNGEQFVYLQFVPTKDQAIKMLRILSFEDCISFWDFYHVTVTDPGGYVSAYMLDENRVVYKEGNHGWSSDFKAVSVNDFAELMIKNWAKDCDGGMYLNQIKVSSHFDLQRDMYLYNI